MSVKKMHRSFVAQIPFPSRGPTKAERTRVEILGAAVEFLWTNQFAN